MSTAAIPQEVAQAATVILRWLAQQAPANGNLSTPADNTVWIDQAASPAGRRRHINECRRLAAEGSDLARVAGRRYYLRPSAVDALLMRTTARRVAVPATEPPDALANLRARYAGLGRAS